MNRTTNNDRAVKLVNVVITIIAIAMIVVILDVLTSSKLYEESMLFEGNKSIYQWGEDSSASFDSVCTTYIWGFYVVFIAMLVFFLGIRKTPENLKAKLTLQVYVVCLLGLIFTEIYLLFLRHKYDMTLYTVNDSREAVAVTNAGGTVVNLYDALIIPRISVAVLAIIIVGMIIVVNKQRNKA